MDDFFYNSRLSEMDNQIKALETHNQKLQNGMKMILDLLSNQVPVLHDPSPDARPPHNFRYENAISDIKRQLDIY